MGRGAGRQAPFIHLAGRPNLMRRILRMATSPQTLTKTKVKTVETLLIGGAEGYLGLEAVVTFAAGGLRVAASVRTRADEDRVRTALRSRGAGTVPVYV